MLFEPHQILLSRLINDHLKHLDPIFETTQHIHIIETTIKDTLEVDLLLELPLLLVKLQLILFLQSRHRLFGPFLVLLLLALCH